MKRVFLILALVVLTCSLTGCGEVLNVKINYGSSNRYSKDDINKAIKVIKKDFKSDFKGSKLHSIEFLSDDFCSSDILNKINSSDKAKNGPFTECILFSSSFHSPKKSGDLEPNYEYTDWLWLLARPENGEWVLLDYGY